MLAEIVQLGLNVPCLLFPQTTAMGKPPDSSAEQYLKCTVYNKSKKKTWLSMLCVGAFPLCRENKGSVSTRLDPEHKGMGTYVAVGAGVCCLE